MILMCKKFIFICVFFVLCILLVGCTDDKKSENIVTNTEEITYYKVTVDGVLQLVIEGEKAVMPSLEKTGFALEGFTCNGQPYDWNSPVLQDLVITSNWSPILPPTQIGFDVSLSVGDATSYWEAEYSFEGITFKVDVTDHNLINNPIDKGMSDNVELVVQCIDSLKYDVGYTINFMCNAEGKYWIRKAKNSSSFLDEGEISNFAKKGINFDFTHELTENGYRVKVFFSWEILNTSYEEGYGNVRFIPSMRNTERTSSTFDFYKEHSCSWGKPYTFVVVDKENRFVTREYKPTNINEAFMNSEIYDQKRLTDNLAVLDGCEASLTARLKVGAMLFKDRNYGINPNALCEDLIGKSYLYDSINGCYGKVTKAGYVILIMPAENYTELCDRVELDGFTQIGKVDRPIASQVVDSILVDPICYYVKWCEEGEIIAYGKYALVVFDELEVVDLDEVWSFTPATFHTDFSNHELIDRHWQGCPTIARTNGGRLFASWVTGDSNEPKDENYEPIVYSDDNGLTWHNLWWISNEHPEAQTNDTQFWVDPDGRLWMCYVQRRKPGGFDKNSGVWAVVIDNPDMDIEELKNMEIKPRRLFDGLLRNNFLVLSDGTWLAAPNDFVDENNTIVYASTDKGKTWTVRGGAYLPIATNFDETILYEKEDGSIWMMVRNTSGKIVECYSYDKGYTWTEAQQTEFNNASTRFNLMKLPSGNLILINNNNSAARNNLTAYLSLDDGVTWPYTMMIDSTYTSYPDIEYNPKTNEIYVIYDQYRTDQGNIHMAVFTEEYLMKHSVIDSDMIYHVACPSRESNSDAEGSYLGDSLWYEKSNGWNLENDNGTNPVAIQMGVGTQYISFKEGLLNNFYVETKVHAHSIVNRDGYPKFGIVLRSADDKQIFYYINGESWFSGTKAWHVGYVENYNWGNEVEVPASIDYVNDYVTLGLMKEGNKFSFYVNGYLVLEGDNLAGMNASSMVEVQFVTFNTRVTYKDYFLTSNTEEAKMKYKNVSIDVLYLGDSFISYKYWKNFNEEMTGINLGVSGTEVSYWINLVDYIALYNPKTIVMHIGVNDLDRGKTGIKTSNLIKQLLETLHEKLPEAKILYISANPSQSYWDRHTEIDISNELVKGYCEEQDYLYYLDFAKNLYLSDKTYVKTSLEIDGLHLNQLGYELWNKEINNALLQMKGADE